MFEKLREALGEDAFFILVLLPLGIFTSVIATGGGILLCYAGTRLVDTYLK